jgi:hemerythrin
LTTEESYGRFVPRQFLQLLNRPSFVDVELGDHVEQEMTLLFSDIRDFTTLSESILPAENFRFINSYLSTMEPVVSSQHGFIDKYIGDGIMALFPTEADHAVRCGIDMLRQLVNYNQGRSRAGYVPIRIGIGINTGLVMMGTVGGRNRMDSTVIGDAVNQASRLESLTKIYRTPLLISEHTLHALADPSVYHIRFVDRVKLKGNYPAQSVFEIFDADPEPLRLAKCETMQTFDEAVAYYHLGIIAEAVPLFEQCLYLAPDDHLANLYLERCLASQRNGEAGGVDSSGSGTSRGNSVKLDGIEYRWRDNYAIGTAGLDRHHADLLEQMGQLANLIGSGRDTKPIIATLAEYLSVHFSAEENLMRRYAYPFISQHQRQHQSFLRSFEKLCNDITLQQRSTMRLLLDVQIFLIDWYVNHITKSDAHLGYYLQRAGLD